MSTTDGQPIQKRHVSYEKLVIGPAMVLSEMVLGGHYMEMVKITRQATMRRYPDIIKDIWRTDGVAGMYKGFVPWGMIQCVKGIPVLFIKTEVEYICRTSLDFGDTASQTIGGVLGGAGQGVFMTPTQRLKTIIMTDPKFQGMTKAEGKGVGALLMDSTKLIGVVLRTEGLASLFRGMTSMTSKRAVDWGIRFYANSFAQQQLRGVEDPERPLTMMERVMAGAFGGFASTLTMPLDTLVANSQKARKAGGAKVTMTSVAKEMYAERGYMAFVAGWQFRALHASWHTIFMTAFASKIYEMVRGMDEK